jgi:hypothetical protein
MKWEGLKLLLGDFPLVRYWISKRRRGNDSTSRLARPRREMQDDENEDCDECDEVDSCR